VTRPSTAASSAAYAAACRKSIWCALRTRYPKVRPTPKSWAATENRVLITNDRNSMVNFAYRRVEAGETVPGLIATTNAQSIGSAIDDILLIVEYMPEEEIQNQVVGFLPFR